MGGREGWTDGGVGPQRRVIHHTTMQSALVQPLFLTLQVFFLFFCFFFPTKNISSPLLLLPFIYSLFPILHSLLDFEINSLLPLIYYQLLNKLSLLPAIFPSLSPWFSLWQSFLGFIISSGNIPPFFSPFSLLLLSLSAFFSTHFHFLSRKSKCFLLFVSLTNKK